jgi:hypothetical protein
MISLRSSHQTRRTSAQDDPGAPLLAIDPGDGVLVGVVRDGVDDEFAARGGLADDRALPRRKTRRRVPPFDANASALPSAGRKRETVVSGTRSVNDCVNPLLLSLSLLIGGEQIRHRSLVRSVGLAVLHRGRAGALRRGS